MADETARVTIQLGGDGSQARHEINSVKSSLEQFGHVAQVAQQHIDRVAKVSEFAAMGFSNWRGIMTGGIAIFSFEQLIRGAMDFDKSIFQLSATLNNDATAASMWNGIAKEMGVNADMLPRAFATFTKEVVNNSDLLKSMGVDVAGLRNGHVSLSNAVLQTADYFKQYAGSSDNARVAQQLFGLSGAQMLPMLQMGREGLGLLSAELQKYGLTLNNATLQQQMAFVFQIQQGEMAVKGLAIQVGNALLPGIAALAQGLAKLIENHLPAFLAGIQRIVSYIIGFVEGMTGMSLAVDNTAVSLGQMSNQVNDGFGPAMVDGAKSTSALTKALQDQVRALQETQAASDFVDRMKKLNQTLADDKGNVLKISTELNAAVLEGDYLKAVSLNEQLNKAKQKQADTETQITRDGAQAQTKSKIDALQDQIRAIEEANIKGVAAVTAAGGAMSASFGAAGAASADKFKFAISAGAEEAGKLAGTNLSSAFTKFVNDPTNLGNLGKLGQGIGNAIGEGIGAGLNQGFNHWKDNNIGSPIQNFLINAIEGHGLSTQNPTQFNTGTGAFNDPNWNSQNHVPSSPTQGASHTFNFYNSGSDPAAVSSAVNNHLSNLLNSF